MNSLTHPATRSAAKVNHLDLRAWHEAKSWLVKEIPARYAALGSVLAIENLESGVALVLDRKAEYSVHAPTLAAGLCAGRGPAQEPLPRAQVGRVHRVRRHEWPAVPR